MFYTRIFQNAQVSVQSFFRSSLLKHDVKSNFPHCRSSRKCLKTWLSTMKWQKNMYDFYICLLIFFCFLILKRFLYTCIIDWLIDESVVAWTMTTLCCSWLKLGSIPQPFPDLNPVPEYNHKKL